MPESLEEKRSEARNPVDGFYSVQFSIDGSPFLYQFKIWDLSAKGMCVLVRENSEILEHLQVGQVLRMRYYRPDSSLPGEDLETEIRHITQAQEGRFRGHALVGLLVLERKEG